MSQVKSDVKPIRDNGIITFCFVLCFLNNNFSYLFVLDRQAFWLVHLDHFLFVDHLDNLLFVDHLDHLLFVDHLDHLLFVDHLDHSLFVDHLDNLLFVDHLQFKPPEQKSNLRAWRNQHYINN
jgi:hypothetical protein